MKLYMIIYIMGKIGGYVGPLPYDMNECQVRTKELFSHVKKDINVV